jgi:hypothetical protein
MKLMSTSIYTTGKDQVSLLLFAYVASICEICKVMELLCVTSQRLFILF